MGRDIRNQCQGHVSVDPRGTALSSAAVPLEYREYLLDLGCRSYLCALVLLRFEIRGGGLYRRSAHVGHAEECPCLLDPGRQGRYRLSLQSRPSRVNSRRRNSTACSIPMTSLRRSPSSFQRRRRRKSRRCDLTPRSGIKANSIPESSVHFVGVACRTFVLSALRLRVHERFRN